MSEWIGMSVSPRTCSQANHRLLYMDESLLQCNLPSTLTLLGKNHQFKKIEGLHLNQMHLNALNLNSEIHVGLPPCPTIFNCHQAIFSALLTYAKSICLHSPTLGEGFAAHYPRPQPASSYPNQLAEYKCDQKDLWKPIFYTSEPHKKAVKKNNLRKMFQKTQAWGRLQLFRGLCARQGAAQHLLRMIMKFAPAAWRLDNNIWWSCCCKSLGWESLRSHETCPVRF